MVDMDPKAVLGIIEDANAVMNQALLVSEVPLVIEVWGSEKKPLLTEEVRKLREGLDRLNENIEALREKW